MKTAYIVEVTHAEYTRGMRLRRPETQRHVCRNLDTAESMAERLAGTDDNRPGGFVVYSVKIYQESVGPDAII